MGEIIKKVWFWPGAGYQIKECIMPEQHKEETPYTLDDYFAYAVKHDICAYMTPEEFDQMVAEDGKDPNNPDDVDSYSDMYMYFDGTDNDLNPVDPVYILIENLKVGKGEDDRLDPKRFYIKKTLEFNIKDIIDTYNSFYSEEEMFYPIDDLDWVLIYKCGLSVRDIVVLFNKCDFDFECDYFRYDEYGNCIYCLNKNEIEDLLTAEDKGFLEELYEELMEDKENE